MKWISLCNMSMQQTQILENNKITNAKSLVEQFPLGNMSLTLSDKPLEIHFKELPSFSYFQNFLSSGVENGTLKIGFKAAHWKRSESFSLTKRCLFWCKTPIHNDQVDLKGSTVTDIILRIDYVNHIKSKKINGFGYSKIKATLIIVTDIMLYAESNSNHKFTTTKIDIHRSNNLLTSGKLNSLPVTLKGIYQDIKSDYYFSLIEKDLKVSNEYLLSGLKNADKVLIYDDERNRRMLILSSFSTTKENTVFTTIKFTQIYYSLQKGILHIKEDFTNIPYSNAKMIGIGYDRINTIYTYIVEDTTKLNSRSVMLAVQLQSGGQSVLFKVTGVEFSNKYIDENFYYFDTERNLFYFKFSKFQGCNEKQLISYNPVTGKIVESFDLPRLSQFTLQPTLESTVGKGISITNFMQRNPTMDSAERVIYLTQFNLTNWDNVKVTPLIEVSENIYLSEIYNFKNSNNYICASFRYYNK
ncbi:hypothetical protein ABK040_016186 [Willaertia magna]